ncbi:PREDICTED: uncharacterized protein LOC106809364 [Priapulus caudatus]|uniref:Uncharacterized protein LOC106809364 n=1 Tax=Priapulus caudatus TaxID=37621 RepID=A0ABM1E6U4_PRICU|nr:PREDICTED: uncharacterized protein LOC106809364 [Priapulus caudatus]
MQTQTMSHARISVIRLLGSGCGNLRRRHLRVLAPVTFKTMSDLPTRDFSLSSRRLLPAGDSKPLVNIAALFGKSPQGGATAKRSRNSVAPSHKRESACGRVDDRDWVHNDDDAVVEADMRKFDLWVAEIEAFVAAGDRRVDAAEWDAFRSRLLAADPTRVKVIDGVVMKKCVHTLHHAVGESFIDYLRRDGGAPNLAVVAHYAALCGRCGDAARRSSPRTSSSRRATRCSTPRPVTSSRRRSARRRAGGTPSPSSRTASGRVDVVGRERTTPSRAARAFRARDLDTGWATIGEATRAGKSIQADVYEEWLRLCVAAR